MNPIAPMYRISADDRAEAALTRLPGSTSVVLRLGQLSLLFESWEHAAAAVEAWDHDLDAVRDSLIGAQP